MIGPRLESVKAVHGHLISKRYHCTCLPLNDMIECYLGTKLVMEMFFDVLNSHRNSTQYQVNLDMSKVNISCQNDHLNTVGVFQFQKVAKTAKKMLLTMLSAMLSVTAILVCLSNSKEIC